MLAQLHSLRCQDLDLLAMTKDGVATGSTAQPVTAKGSTLKQI